MIGLDLMQVTKYAQISDYFVGSGKYLDGARAANDLRLAALYLSVAGFFLTAILLIVSAIAACSHQKIKILTVTLVCMA